MPSYAAHGHSHMASLATPNIRGIDRPMMPSDINDIDLESLRETLEAYEGLPWRPPVRKLAMFCRRFLASPHFDRAVECGWTTADLFGVDPDMPRGELVGGLMAELARAKNKVRVAGFDRAHCKIRLLDSGKIILHRRWQWSRLRPLWEIGELPLV